MAGTIWMNLPAEIRGDLVRFHEACVQRSIDRWELLRRFDEGALGAVQVSPPLEEVIQQLLLAKSTAGRSFRYTQVLGIILQGFARGRERMPIARITLQDVEAWLNGKNLAGRATFRARLSTLFNFALRRGYVTRNPCADLENTMVAKPPPSFLTVEQTAKCLEHLEQVDPRGMAWFVLSTFCGLRPEEAERTLWSAIEIDNGEAHIRVEGQTSKKKQRRIVSPLPEAVVWLKHARGLQSQLPLTAQERRLTIRKLREVLGFPVWPKDITRHSAASYWLAIDGNPLHIAEQLGHTVSELKSSYKVLVTKAEAQRFWALRPTI
jgi:integrase